MPTATLSRRATTLQAARPLKALAVAAALVLTAAVPARAEPLLLIGWHWGEQDQWVGGRFPGPTDDVAFIEREVRLTTLAGAPFAATARHVPAADLFWVPGSQLSAARLDRTRVDMRGGLLAVRGAGAGNETMLGLTRIHANGPVTPSVMTVVSPGEVRFESDSTIDGSLDLRGHGRFVNAAGSTMSIRNNGIDFDRTGGLTLFFGASLTNHGTISLDGGARIGSRNPDPSDVNALRFENAPGGSIAAVGTLPGGAAITTRLDNAGTVSVSDGLLTLSAGGTHGGTGALPAQWLSGAAGSRLVLLDEHVVTGTVHAAGGPGWVAVGGPFGAAGRVTVGGGGTLLSASRMEVNSGGQIHVADLGRWRTEAGSFTIASGAIEVQAGGSVEHHGDLQLLSSFTNHGAVRIAGQLYGDQGSAFVQRSGARLEIDAGGSLNLTDCCTGRPPGSFVQEGGSTLVNGLLRAGGVRFESGTLGGSGVIEYTRAFSSAVFFGRGLTVRIGNSPGALTIDGNLQASGAVFDIEIAGSGAGSFDQLFVTGDADLTDAVVNFQFIDGFLPAVGDSFSWLEAAGFAAGLDTLTVSLTSDAGTVEGSINNLGRLVIASVTPVPEPGTWALWMGGLAALGFVARRRPKPR
jgi:MYXO-CTERM domain-containing protein